jgi:tRNA (guanine37-N1)-methyltransferase
MIIDILTLFPEMFVGPFNQSIVKRAMDKGLVEIRFHNLRDWSTDAYKSVDDRPYGGGVGMIMRVDIIDRALKDIKKDSDETVILTDAGGKKFDQRMAETWSKLPHLILIAGHYEGVDHRVNEHLVDEAVSIGDFVLSGGEVAIMTMVDAVVRLIPGTLGNPKSLDEESHNVLTNCEYPQYTRPEEYNGWKVPEVLLSGNHKKIEEWKEAHEKQLDNQSL